MNRLYIEWIIHWYKNLLCRVPQRLCFSKLNHLQKFFTWNTKNTDINGENEQNTHMHTKHSEQDNIGKG